MSIHATVKIAEYEFSRAIANPITIVVTILLVALSIINIAGFSTLLSRMEGYFEYTEIFFIMIGNFFYILSMVLAFLSMCVTIVSISEDRSAGSMRTLIVKPIYRRDIILGKFLGLSAFMLTIILFILTIFVSLMIIYRGMPHPFPDVLIRLVSYTAMLFLNSAFTLGVVMLFTSLFKNLTDALVASISYICIEWLALGMPGIITNNLANPSYLYLHTVANTGNSLLSTMCTYASWLESSLPYIVLIIAEVVIVVLLDIIIFNSEEC